MKIFKVISNIKHNGTDFLKGSFIAEEFVGSEILVNDGVLKVIDGAETIEEAKAIDAETQAIEEATAEEVVEPKDTWAPEPDEPIVATGTIVDDEETPTTEEEVEETKEEEAGDVEPTIEEDNL